MSVSPPQNGNSGLFPIPGRPLNPAELKIDLLCRGMRLDKGCMRLGEELPPVRTRAGLIRGILFTPGTADRSTVSPERSMHSVRRLTSRSDMPEKKTAIRNADIW